MGARVGSDAVAELMTLASSLGALSVLFGLKHVFD